MNVDLIFSQSISNFKHNIKNADNWVKSKIEDNST